MQQHFSPANPEDARRVITAQALQRTVVVYFVKRTDDTERRMVCRIFDRPGRRYRFDPTEKLLLEVWDVEKGAIRMISLDRVEEIVWNEPDPAPAPDRPARRSGPQRSFEDLRREMHELF